MTHRIKTQIIRCDTHCTEIVITETVPVGGWSSYHLLCDILQHLLLKGLIIFLTDADALSSSPIKADKSKLGAMI